ncbi:MAG: Spy/CpxP family protein refolding chaperone [Ensifer alkalisoli]|nr:Spy/CpxP family protein refolding chaperone [Sinorhizobium alkalisoli]
MATPRMILLASSLFLLGTPGFSEDAHHPESTAGQMSEQTTQTQAPATSPSAMMPHGMMSGGMMSGMMGMMGGGQAPLGMMGAGQGPMGPPDMGLMAKMMAPEHIEGRLAFLKTELKIKPEQESLWNAFAEVLRANARGVQDGMMQMPGAMGPGGPAATPLQRIEFRESALANRLDGVRKLKGALAPLYQALDGTQKQMADRLLLPPMMGMM